MRKYLYMAVVMFLAAAGLGGMTASATAGPDTDYQGVHVVHVKSPNEVPADAVLYYKHKRTDCSTKYIWRLTIPGNDQTMHKKYRYKRDIPAVAEQSHMEYRYQRTVQDYKTQYHFRKFTHTKTKAPGASEWSDYGPWTPWVPKTHESWQDTNTPLGQPEYHGSGTYPDGTQWYRQWQAQADGETRQVENGAHVETTDWLTTPPTGDGWQQIDERKVVDVEAVPGYTEYFVLGGVPSQNEAEASWILESQIPANEGWVWFQWKDVVDQQETPTVITDYVYNDGKKCSTPPPPKHHKSPHVPTLIDAGL